MEMDNYPFKKIGDGAEAIIYLDDSNKKLMTVIKDRVSKAYRHKDIDKKLRQFRSRREAKVLDKLQTINFPSPKLIQLDDKKFQIRMEFINSPRLRDVLAKKDFKKISKEIGMYIALLHDNHIVHGDLTTSNILFGDKIYFIDFGLSFFTHKFEDKAVDIHLFKHALESKHHLIWKDCFDYFLKGYKSSKNFKDVTNRLIVVEGRGKYKGKH